MKYLWGVAHVLRVLLVCVSIQSIPTKHIYIYISGWWFGTFFIFHFIHGLSSFPLTKIFFKMVKTTNQIYIYIPSGKLT